jgi:hypothetical protein
MIFIGGDTRLQQMLRDALNVASNDLLGNLQNRAQLVKEIEDLKIERDRRQEEYDRREREVEHKVGLERKRQEFEIVQTKRETTVQVREENLEADKERFKAEMEFQRKHLEDEIGSLRELVNNMMKRLPSAEIFAKVKSD